jgi:hypothetical protein
MVGGWVVFYALMLFSEPTLGDLREHLRDLPLVVEGVVWLLLFPYVLALTIWESSWASGFASRSSPAARAGGRSPSTRGDAPPLRRAQRRRKRWLQSRRAGVPIRWGVGARFGSGRA